MYIINWVKFERNKSFICIHTNVFAYLICILTGEIHGKTNNQRDFIHELHGARFCNKG